MASITVLKLTALLVIVMCVFFSITSLQQTQEIQISTSNDLNIQQTAQFTQEQQDKILKELLASLDNTESDNPTYEYLRQYYNQVPSPIPPSISPAPYVRYITTSLHGTRKRQTQPTYFDTTTNTPLEIPLLDILDKSRMDTKNLIFESTYGMITMKDNTTLRYTPQDFFNGYDTISVRDPSKGNRTIAGKNIRIRTGVVMNQPLLRTPPQYTFAENSAEASYYTKLYFYQLRNQKLFPEHDTWLNRRYNTCAVVGNGGSLIGRKRGAEIDSHDVVVRLNVSPMIGYQEDVGSKISIGISNGPTAAQCWKRNRTQILENNNQNYEILAQATFRIQWQRMVQCRELYPTMMYTPMNYLFVDLVDSILKEYQKAKFNNTERKYRSTGMIAVTAMAMICDHVSVYGFERGPNMENFYYNSSITEHEWSGHSYRTEKEYFKDLAKGTGLFEPFLELYDLYKSFSYIVD